MKIKQHVMISNPDDFRLGYYKTCFTLMGPEMAERFRKDDYQYIDCGEITLDIDVTHDQAVTAIVSAIDAQVTKEQGEHELKMNLLKARKNELLALTHEKAA